MELATSSKDRDAAADAAEAEGSSRAALRSAVVYAFGYGLQRGLAFLMLPLYTRALGPAEYGVLGVLLSIMGAAMMVLPLGLDIAVIRRYFEFADDLPRQKLFVDSIWRFLVVLPIGGALILAAVAWPVVTALTDETNGLDVLLMLLSAALWVAGTTVPFAVLRAEQMLRKYLVITGVTAFATVGITGLFVVVLDWGVRGWLGATAIANLIVLITAATVIPWRRGGSYDAKMVRDSLRFSLPLLPQSASSWALQMLDRTIIAGIVTAVALGVYTLAANVATPVMMVLISLNQGFAPTYARAGSGLVSKGALRDVVVLQALLVVVVTLAGCLLAPPLIQIASPGSYHEAASVVGWLILGYGIFGIYFIPMNGATLAAGRGAYSWVASSLSVVVNAVLLIVFVPDHGIRAAAIAAAVAYFALLVGNGIYAHAGENPVRYDLRRILPGTAIAGAAYVLATVFAPSSAAATFAVNTGWVALVCVLLVGLDLAPLRSVKSS